MKKIKRIAIQFLEEQKWIKHMIFWLAYWLFQSFLMNDENNLLFYLTKNFAMVSLQMLLVYFNLFVLIPQILLTGHRILYIFLAAIIIYLTYTISFRWIQLVLEKVHLVFPVVHAIKFPESLLNFNLDFWSVFSDSVPYSLAIACSTSYFISIINIEKEKEKAWLTIEKQNTELRLLKSQISPHFLFNSLNNLHYLIGKDRGLSEKYTLKLSEVLRYIVYESREDIVPLDAEINHVKSYVELMKISIENPDKIVWKEKIDFKSYNISPLILLSIIENGFKHSGIKHNSNAHLKIVVEVENYRLSLRMVNTIDENVSFSSEKSNSLKNLQKRLTILYKENYQFHLEIGKQKAFTTLIIKLN